MNDIDIEDFKNNEHKLSIRLPASLCGFNSGNRGFRMAQGFDNYREIQMNLKIEP
jgi:hypothetical protein